MTPGLFLIAGLLFILALLAGLVLLTWILVVGGSLALRWAALNPPPLPRAQPPLVDQWADVGPQEGLDEVVEVPVVRVIRVSPHRRGGRR